MNRNLQNISAALVILVAGWALVSCDSATSTSELSALQGHWELQRIDLLDGGVAPVPDPENYTIRFDADGRVNVQADCNMCNGSYQTDGTGLTIEPLACTRAFCPPPSLGNLYTVVLGTTTSLQRNGEQLFIRYAGGGAIAFTLAD